MNREIKFRAWDKEKKLMAYDIQNEYDTIGKVRFSDGSEPGEKCFASYLYNNNYIVMQYIGLKDKNEKEIYEGDIVYKYEIKDHIVAGKVLGKEIVNKKYGVIEYISNGEISGNDEGFILPGFFIRLTTGRFMPKQIFFVNYTNTEIATKPDIEPIIQDYSYLESFGSFYPGYTPETEIEIIGNIYENPKLLK